MSVDKCDEGGGDGSGVLTWDKTTSPSLDRWMSVSRACAPTSTAALKAAMVFSGYWALKPRWAMVWGTVEPLLVFLAKVHVAGYSAD